MAAAVPYTISITYGSRTICFEGEPIERKRFKRANVAENTLDLPFRQLMSSMDKR
jgi:hypothetical protein